jgi:2,4-dienoyl-CoA reductase-like NADH-dependent reductase (Old Yellow Enzyme family)/thioredoxin reductase
MSKFTHAFRPISVGPLKIKNRIEVSPAEPFLCTRDGLVTDEFVAFTAAMAKGGAGIVTVGDSPVNPDYAQENHYVVNLSDPLVVHGLFKVTDAIHRYNAVASIELNLRAHYLPGDLTREEIRRIIADFADSAERCRKAGFDMVMIHGGHGHTVSQFYSPFFNKRTDEYSCSTMENRCRFACELISAVRERIGPDMAIEYRISGDEMIPEGVGLEDAVKFAAYIQDKIDLIHVSAGNMYDPRTAEYIMQPSYMPMATNLHLAERFKKELRIPVTTVGSFNMELAESAVKDGKADIVAMIRAFIADPEHVNKARLDREDEIRPCIRCNMCTGDDPHGCPKPLRCAVNPASGRNPHFDEIRNAEAPKKVVIIGGGCAGMEAARRLAQRGHHPVLFEKNPALGGSLIEAGSNRIKGDIRRYAEWSVRMTERAKDVDLRLNTKATRKMVEDLKPDAVIIAVGSEQIVPDIPGINGKNVVLAVDLDMGRAKAGREVLIVGAGLTGSETAVELLKEGHQVTLLDMLTLKQIAARDKSIGRIHGLAERHGAKFLEEMKLIEIGDGFAVAADKSGALTKLYCDTVALSLGVRPRTKVIEEFLDLCPETYVIGDCANKAGNIASAVREGFYAAMNI